MDVAKLEQQQRQREINAQLGADYAEANKAFDRPNDFEESIRQKEAQDVEFAKLQTEEARENWRKIARVQADRERDRATLAKQTAAEATKTAQQKYLSEREAWQSKWEQMIADATHAGENLLTHKMSLDRERAVNMMLIEGQQKGYFDEQQGQMITAYTKSNPYYRPLNDGSQEPATSRQPIPQAQPQPEAQQVPTPQVAPAYQQALEQAQPITKEVVGNFLRQFPDFPQTNEATERLLERVASDFGAQDIGTVAQFNPQLALNYLTGAHRACLADGEYQPQSNQPPVQQASTPAPTQQEQDEQAYWNMSLSELRSAGMRQ